MTTTSGGPPTDDEARPSGQGPDPNVEAPATDSADENATAGQDCNGAELPAFAELLSCVGYLDTDLISINHKHPRGAFLPTPNVAVPHAPHEAAQYTHDLNVWWSVNPLREGIQPGKRGAEIDVTRLAALFADLDAANLYPPDAKPSALPTLADAVAVINDVADILGMRPAYVVCSGHGLQPLWPLEASSAAGLDRRRAKALLKAFGDLVALVAARRFGDTVKIDNVYDLAHVLRVPGTDNVKFGEKVEVTGWADTGAPMTVDYVIEALATVGIELTDDEDLLTGEVLSAPEGWTFRPGGCGYMAQTIQNWTEDPMPDDRHGWHYNKSIKVACAWRYGCFRNQGEFDAANAVLDNRLRGWRELSDADECNRNRRDARKKVSTFTDEKVREELGVNEQLLQHMPHPLAVSTTDTAVFTLSDAHAVFMSWFGKDYDIGSLDATLAVAAAARLTGDAPWLLLVSGSGTAKTETLMPLAGCADVKLTSTISSEGALLSGTARKDRASSATGGLLNQIGEFGILVIKDVTSILSLSGEHRAKVFAALREIHDGSWTRSLGVDGGRQIPWKGRIIIIGAVTSAWDRAYSAIAAMGDRFVLYRIDSHEGRDTAGRQAIANVGLEREMRTQLATAVEGVLAGMSEDNVDLTDEDKEVIYQAANLVTLARSNVDTDFKGDPIIADMPESPTRFAKQLTQIMRGGIAIGMGRNDALRLAMRCAADSIPPLRLQLLRHLQVYPSSTTTDVRRRLNLPRSTVDRGLQTLQLLRLLVVAEGVRLSNLSDDETGTITIWKYSLAPEIYPDVLRPPV